MMRWLTRTLAGGALAFAAGCSQPAPPPPPDTPPEITNPVEIVPTAEKPPVAEVVKPVEPKAEPFRFAADAAGKTIERALTPKPQPVAATRVTAPRPRTSAAERGDLPLPKPAVKAAPLPLTARKPGVPSAPREGVPLTVGVGLELNLKDTKLPESPTVKSPPRPQPTAADVPRLASQLPDRAPVDDPTAEISTVRIVNTVILAPTLAAPFVRLLLPDPFEFAGQVKPPVAPEFGTSPTFVPPARP